MYCVSNVMRVEGKEVALITIGNKNNTQLKLLSYGAVIVELLAPDREGDLENIVLTYRDIEDYIKNKPYFGAIIGRTSGRIGGGVFELCGQKHQLCQNDGTNNLHGGLGGLSFRIWEYTIEEEADRSWVEFSYISRDMEEGYPGNMNVKVRYILTDENELIIEYNAETDRDTLCNLTNHSYFNLSGNYKRKVSQQHLKLKSDHYLETDSDLIPTGKLLEVKGTPMDFNAGKLIGKDIDADFLPLVNAKGYDCPWMLSGASEQIELYDETSGRKMTVSTTYPCVVIYTYNFADNEKLKYGMLGSKCDGICFETQYEPDGINHPGMHTAVLKAGSSYNERTVFKLEVV